MTEDKTPSNDIPETSEETRALVKSLINEMALNEMMEVALELQKRVFLKVLDQVLSQQKGSRQQRMIAKTFRDNAELIFNQTQQSSVVNCGNVCVEMANAIMAGTDFKKAKAIGFNTVESIVEAMKLDTQVMKRG